MLRGIPRPEKPHIDFIGHDDILKRGWWVHDPMHGLSLGPYDWKAVNRVARSIDQSLREQRAADD
jgi:hypothetical protein